MIKLSSILKLDIVSASREIEYLPKDKRAKYMSIYIKNICRLRSKTKGHNTWLYINDTQELKSRYIVDHLQEES